MLRALLVLSCLFGTSLAQAYDCAACLCSDGNTREEALGCMSFCNAEGSNQDGIITRDELSAVFNSWNPVDGYCDEACFAAAHAQFPACANEDQCIFQYFSAFDGDYSSISDPVDIDGWYNDLVRANGGAEPVDAAAYRVWWNAVYNLCQDEANCGVPCP